MKPFGQRRTASSSPLPLILLLRWGRPQVPEPAKDEFVSDEREARVAGRAHYQAYRAMSVGMILLFAASMSLVGHRNLLVLLPLPPEQSLFVLVWVVFLVYWHLPQTIVLWSEPDMEE